MSGVASERGSQASAAFAQAVDDSGIFPRNGPDPSARLWGHSKSGITFASQHKIPKQPLPSLESSCKKFLETVQPLQSDEAHSRTKVAVQNFLDGEGPVLQAQLEAYDKSHVNWFEHYCYEAFLSDFSPVVLNSNAFIAFKDDPDPARNEQITRATALVRSAASFSQAIREDRLPPDEVRGTPMCSYQFWWLFGATRVPAEDGGRLRLDADSRHIIVLCRGQIYRLNVINEALTNIIPEKDLQESLSAIVEDAARLPAEEIPKESVGLLTTENQHTWARCRIALVKEGLRNGRNIGVIDSSLFALCLDDNSPEEPNGFCKNFICGTNVTRKGVQVGTCLNRWYDKVSIIVCRNGKAGMNLEHTCSDGSVDIRMACDIYTGSLSNSSQETDSSLDPSSRLDSSVMAAKPQKLRWDISSEIETALEQAQKSLSALIDRHDIECLDYGGYGTSFMKANGFSPDAFFEMVLQGAYHSLRGRVDNTFEPVLMRQFLHGRTDIVRATTLESQRFASALWDDSVDAGEKIEAMRAAANKHIAMIKDVAKGNGHHRHLYVLNKMWRRKQAFLEASAGLTRSAATDSEESLIFTDPGWATLGKTLVMGSNVENSVLAYACFGPAGDQAFTVVYTIRPEHMSMAVCSRSGQTKEYVEAIERTFDKLKTLLGEGEKH